MVICKICNKKVKILNSLHLLKKHKLTLKDYLNLYPNSETYSRKTLKSYEKKIVQEYQAGKSSIQLSKKYKYDCAGICALLKKNNVTRPMSLSKRKYTINENYFDNINNEGKAYFLGFLYADGYNNEKNNMVSLCLHRKDKEILLKLRKEINSNKPLRTENHLYYKLIIENKHISEQVAKMGCMQAKTFKICFPSFNIISENLIHHFMRGYFDGDGYVSKDKKKSSSQNISITSNKKFLLNYIKYLAKKCDLNPVKTCKYKTTKIISAVYGGRNQVCRIYNFLYKDATFFLQRKKKRFLKILEGKYLIDRHRYKERILV
jgi:hypothetical protein